MISMDEMDKVKIKLLIVNVDVYLGDLNEVFFYYESILLIFLKVFGL